MNILEIIKMFIYVKFDLNDYSEEVLGHQDEL